MPGRMSGGRLGAKPGLGLGLGLGLQLEPGLWLGALA